MTLPTTEECIEYGKSIGLSMDDSEHFFDHFESNGWRVGRNPMKNWQAAMRNWLRNKRKWNNERDFSPRAINDVKQETRTAMGLSGVDDKSQVKNGGSLWDALGLESVHGNGSSTNGAEVHKRRSRES